MWAFRKGLFEARPEGGLIQPPEKNWVSIPSIPYTKVYVVLHWNSNFCLQHTFLGHFQLGLYQGHEKWRDSKTISRFASGWRVGDPTLVRTRPHRLLFALFLAVSWQERLSWNIKLKRSSSKWKTPRQVRGDKIKNSASYTIGNKHAHVIRS